jgi:hypothetical protein
VQVSDMQQRLCCPVTRSCRSGAPCSTTLLCGCRQCGIMEFTPVMSHQGLPMAQVHKQSKLGAGLAVLPILACFRGVSWQSAGTQQCMHLHTTLPAIDDKLPPAWWL